MHTARRRFLAQSAAASLAAAAAWLGNRHLNRPPPLIIRRIGLPFGHALRDFNFADTQVQHEQRADILILGSGAAALTALWYLNRHGVHDITLAEGIEKNGNNAAYHRSGLRAPGGAHYLALPSQESRDVRQLLADLGILKSGLNSATPHYRETDLVHAPAERLYYRDTWQEALLPQEDDDSRRFLAFVQKLKSARGRDGRKIFAIPIVESSADSDWRALDQLTFAGWLRRENYRSPGLLWYLDYCCRDDYGAGIHAVSAFAGLHYFAARGHDQDAVLTWPDGLAHLSERIRSHCGLEKNRGQPRTLNASALYIRERHEYVEALLRDNYSGTLTRIRARHVISAMPLMIAARITENAAGYGLLAGRGEYAPWLVSNFHLRPLPPEKHDAVLAWDNVIHDSPALGYIAANNQQILVAKAAETLFTAYSALNHDSPANIRRWLLEANETELLAHAAQDLVTAYGKSIWRYIKQVDIAVRAHAMRIPIPGYLSDTQLHAVRAHRSRLLFAHSDLSGYSVFEEAAYWGVQAAKQVLAQRG